MKYGLAYAAAFEADETATARLRQLIADIYHSGATKEWLASETGKDATQYEAVSRYTSACRWVVPWALKYCPLAGADVIDIGCGTGATMTAFSHVANRIVGYEIEEKSVTAAHRRFAIMGCSNCEATLVTPDQQLDLIRAEHPNGAQFVLLFAVLEHLTQEERQHYLSTVWRDILRPGGYLIVVDTPNRLAYFDAHTSHLPFFHLLPPELGLRYFNRSPRAEFVNGMRDYIGGTADPAIGLHRWGLGPSYHDFEIAFDVASLDGLIVANGFEWEMTNWFPPGIDDQTLIHYFIERGVDKDIGFARCVLNLIFRKPGYDGATARPSIGQDHLQVLVDYHHLDPRLLSRFGY